MPTERGSGERGVVLCHLSSLLLIFILLSISLPPPPPRLRRLRRRRSRLRLPLLPPLVLLFCTETETLSYLVVAQSWVSESQFLVTNLNTGGRELLEANLRLRESRKFNVKMY